MASSSPQSSIRVAIVGAGVAGLSAARELLASGRLKTNELIVLEASGRIGGRVHSLPFGSQKRVKIDAGAAWIHGASDSNVFFRDVVLPAQIAYTPISDRNPWLHPASCNGYQLFDGRELLSDEVTQHAWKISDALLETLQYYATTEELHQAHGDWSVQRILDRILQERDNDVQTATASVFKELVLGHARGRELLQMCLALIEMWMGASSDQLQLEDFEEIDLIGDDVGPHCLVKGGMEQTVEYLASSIPDGVIHTNSPVELVAYSPADGVTLHLDNGDRLVRADYAIVTCSLGALKTETIKFAPPLPDEKRNVIERSCMGHYMKVLVEFPHVFWPEHGHYFGNVATFGASQQSRFRFPLVFSYLGLKGVPVLEGVLYGPSAVEASELEDEALVAALVQSLKDMFGDDIPAPKTHFVTRWNKNPWTLGAYSYLTLDSTTSDPAILRQTVAGRVLFAGEATIMQYQGSLQGAYMTGLAAVKNLEGLVARPTDP